MTTVAEIRADGLRLAIDCGHCSRLRYLSMNRFADEDRVEDLAASMKCTRCLSEDVTVRIISRDAKTGFWPAEQA
jgi:hypothetical protein